jgi:hypothetical protein
LFVIALVGCKTDDTDDTDVTDTDVTDTDVTCAEPTEDDKLESVKVSTAPTMNGDGADDVWSCLPTLEVELTADVVYTPEGSAVAPAYPGVASTTTSIKSVYTDTDVYFLVQWDDPTHSLDRYPWEKGTDGTWSQLVNKDSSGHENTYYEDKYAFQWDVSSAGFASQGCYAGCHTSGDNAAPGKKYNAEDEITDMWHWKSVRTEPNGQLDDKYVSYVASGLCDGDNCRLADAKDGGGYVDNNFGKFGTDCAADPDGTLFLPCFMGPTGAEIMGDSWIFDDEKQTFVDTFAAGDQVAGMITAPFSGSRGDVSTAASWKDGVWTLEIVRALTTVSAGEDVQFDTSGTNTFGVAVFDNTQINHAAHAGVLELTFRP